jgi:Glycosyl hydrolase family 115
MILSTNPSPIIMVLSWAQGTEHSYYSCDEFLKCYSHHEPMARGTPNEFNVVAKGKWDYVNNKEEIQKYWLDGVERAKTFETVYTLGMRGFGDRMSKHATFLPFQLRFFRYLVPLTEDISIGLLEGVIADQANIFKQVLGEDYDISTVPQVWTLCTPSLL